MAKKNTKRKNSKHANLAAIAIAAAAVAVIALILWTSRPGPLDKVRSAAENTLFAENFTAKFLLDVNGSNGTSTTVDITDRMSNFFTLLEKNGQPDWSVLLDLSEIDLHQAISKDFDFDTFLSCLGKWLDKMNDTGWAKKYAGYSGGHGYHRLLY